jgi:CO/xanthine dehydrogenase FAD-binding subunit
LNAREGHSIRALVPSIEIDVAQDLRHALELMGGAGPDTRLVAGATDVIIRLHIGKLTAKRLVSIADVDELAYIREFNGGIRIGANALVADFTTNPIVEREFPCLRSAAREFASPQIRNRATVGGNIANASPAADTVPALIALGAEVTLQSAGKERRMPLEDLFVGPGKSKMEPGEIITEVRAPRRAGTFQAFAKFGNRSANVIAIINMAMCLRLDGRRIAEARVAYGSCAPVPLRARAVEAMLTGQTLDGGLVGAVGEAVRKDIKPISDVRGSKEYKELLAVNATEDALAGALAEADASH